MKAAAACSSDCIVCGGSGAGDTQDNQLVAGTQIVVPFDSTNYASGQCPDLWGQNCKALDTCCGSLPAAAPFAQACATALNAALGDETKCSNAQSTYCPTTPGCAALKGCCTALDAGSTAQTSCFNTLTSSESSTGTIVAHSADGGVVDAGSGPDSICSAAIAEYGAYNAQACPLGTQCTALAACCAALPNNDAGTGIQYTCQNDLISANGNESSCAAYTPRFGSYNPTACPLGPECTQLSTCCAGLTGTAATSCAANLTAAAGSESYCQQYIPEYGSYNPTACPLGPSCTQLNACCASLSGANQTTCNSYLTTAQGSESYCTSSLESYTSYPACLGPHCQALSTCCATFTGQAQTTCQSYVTTEANCTTYAQDLCPSTPNCSALKTCCGTLQSATAVSNCMSFLVSSGANETSCLSYENYYCPTGPNCTALKSCCEAPGQTAVATCEEDLYYSQGTESSCLSYKTNYFTCPVTDGGP
jgi:hypothetical protein